MQFFSIKVVGLQEILKIKSWYGFFIISISNKIFRGALITARLRVAFVRDPLNLMRIIPMKGEKQ
jgi:hypothetical protein